MLLGIGLPSTIPGVPGSVLVEWSRRAERRGFSTLCAVDRLVYGNYDPLVAIAAAGAVTTHIALSTAVVLAPLRANHAEFAKQVASIDRLTDGRLTLGLAVGSRRDDYQASGVEFRQRGRLFDQLLETSTAIWRGEDPQVGPVPTRPEGPPLFFGGASDATFARAARFGVGWVAGSGGPTGFTTGIQRAAEAFEARGRPERPRGMAINYFGLGPDADRMARETIGNYYAYRGADVAAQIIGGACTSPDAIRLLAEQFSTAGCDELVWTPTSPDPDQVDLLADALGLD